MFLVVIDVPLQSCCLHALFLVSHRLYRCIALYGGLISTCTVLLHFLSVLPTPLSHCPCVALPLSCLLPGQVGQLHGDMTPLERAAVLEGARKGAFQLLLVSDVAARGIDLPQVSGVLASALHCAALRSAFRCACCLSTACSTCAVTLWLWFCV